MKTQSTDTSPEAEQIQIALLRQASAARHVSLTCALTQMVVQLSWRGIKRAHPGLDDRTTRLVSVALDYGRVLADNLSAALERKQIMNLPPNILTAVAPVIEALERAGVAYFIGGSVASSVYGMPRSTMDVDLVADLRSEHVRPLVEQLQAA